jgi:hypothetical protein
VATRPSGQRRASQLAGDKQRFGIELVCSHEIPWTLFDRWSFQNSISACGSVLRSCCNFLWRDAERIIAQSVRRDKPA